MTPTIKKRGFPFFPWGIECLVTVKDKAPTINETNPAMFFPKDEKEQREKEIVKKFRDDVKNLNGHEFNKKYHNKNRGDNVFDD